MSSANARKLPQTPDQATHNDVTSRLEPSANSPPPPPPSKNIETENAELRKVSAKISYVVCKPYMEQKRLAWCPAAH